MLAKRARWIMGNANRSLGLPNPVNGVLTIVWNPIAALTLLQRPVEHVWPRPFLIASPIGFSLSGLFFKITSHSDSPHQQRHDVPQRVEQFWLLSLTSDGRKFFFAGSYKRAFAVNQVTSIPFLLHMENMPATLRLVHVRAIQSASEHPR